MTRPANPTRIRPIELLSLPSATARQTDDEATLRRLLAASLDSIKILDLDGRILFMNEGGMQAMEVKDFAAIGGAAWPDLWRPEDRALAIEALYTARAGSVGRFRGRKATLAGTLKWWDVSVSAIPSHAGEPNALLAISRDISELKEAQQRLDLLNQELAHRVKNILALVQAVASQSFRNVEDVAVARETLSERLIALSQAQDLVMQAAKMEVDLADLVTAELRAHQSNDFARIAICGPRLVIGAKSALALGLLVSELSTYSARYGALAAPAGRLSVEWSAGPDGLVFAWIEGGAPDALAVPWFGDRLLDKALAASLSAQVAVAPTDDGLRVEIAAPLDALSQ